MKPEMEILVWGANYNTCPLEVRERLVLPSTELDRVLGVLSQVTDEGVVLSTCHRLEVYALSQDSHGLAEELLRLLSRWSGLDPTELVGHSYLRHGREAIHHLFTVSSGLDSLIPGEVQVLGQVKSALEHAQALGAAGPTLSTLFDHAISSGKRVRTETSLGVKDASLSAAAVRYAYRVLGGLKGRRALIIGAGKMGLLAARSLREGGVLQIAVASRTPESAHEMAAKVEGTTLDFDRLEEALRECDVVISCTGSPYYVLPYGAVRRSVGRRHSPLVVIDLAMPRDVDPRVGDVDGVVLLDVDDLKHAEIRFSASVRDDLPRARAIVDEEVREFEAWLREREVIATVATLYQQAERIREGELARSAAAFGGPSEAVWDTLDAMTRSIVKKLLHTPATRLRQMARAGNGQRYREIVCELFGLVEEGAASNMVGECGAAHATGPESRPVGRRPRLLSHSDGTHRRDR